MSAPVLLNLLKELKKRNELRGLLQKIFIFVVSLIENSLLTVISITFIENSLLTIISITCVKRPL